MTFKGEKSDAKLRFFTHPDEGQHPSGAPPVSSVRVIPRIADGARGIDVDILLLKACSMELIYDRTVVVKQPLSA